jgi:hypothetical protein
MPMMSEPKIANFLEGADAHAFENAVREAVERAVAELEKNGRVDAAIPTNMEIQEYGFDWGLVYVHFEGMDAVSAKGRTPDEIRQSTFDLLMTLSND